MIRDWLTIALVFLACSGILAQDGPYEVSGKVVDGNTRQALSAVNVTLLENSNKGTISDNEGLFTIRLDSLPATLVFSMIGYETIRIPVSSPQSLSIELYPISTELPKIVVRARAKIDTIYKEPYSVVDYTFWEEYMVLLVYKDYFEKYELVLLSASEEVLSTFSLKEYRPVSLFKSCVDRVYLTTTLGVYNVLIDKEKVSVGDWVAEDHFEQVIRPCILSMDSLLFYQRHLYQGQALRFYAFINDVVAEDSLTFLPLIEDKAQIRRLIEETGHRMPFGGDLWSENLGYEYLELREKPYFLKGKLRLFFPKIYAPLVQVDSSLCVFNHLGSALQYFNPQGKLIKEVSINYHKMKRWKKYILFDEVSTKAYTAFHTRWGQYICEINLEDGSLSEAIQLDLDFIDKVTVRDGVLYFLYRNPYQGARNRMVQKVILSPSFAKSNG